MMSSMLLQHSMLRYHQAALLVSTITTPITVAWLPVGFPARLYVRDYDQE